MGLAILSIGTLTANFYLTHVGGALKQHVSSEDMLDVLTDEKSVLAASRRVLQGEGRLSASQGGPGLGAAAVHPVRFHCYLHNRKV